MNAIVFLIVDFARTVTLQACSPHFIPVHSKCTRTWNGRGLLCRGLLCWRSESCPTAPCGWRRRGGREQRGRWGRAGHAPVLVNVWWWRCRARAPPHAAPPRPARAARPRRVPHTRAGSRQPVTGDVRPCDSPDSSREGRSTCHRAGKTGLSDTNGAAAAHTVASDTGAWARGGAGTYRGPAGTLQAVPTAVVPTHCPLESRPCDTPARGHQRALRTVGAGRGLTEAQIVHWSCGGRHDRGGAALTSRRRGSVPLTSVEPRRGAFHAWRHLLRGRRRHRRRGAPW